MSMKRMKERISRYVMKDIGSTCSTKAHMIRVTQITYKQPKNTISCDHYLRRKLITKGLISLRAQQSKEREENDRCQEDNGYHGISQMDVNT